MRALCVCLVLGFAVALGGCGRVVNTSEPDLQGSSPAGAPAPTRARAPAPGATPGRLHIAVVTHGQASDPFWSVVRSGISDAARQLGVSATYSAPDTIDLVRMRDLVEEAVRSRPDGLVVSIPDLPILGDAIRAAVHAGIPVITINSGAEGFRRVGSLLHVGQPERQAGMGAGQRLAASGVRRALCVDHEPGNNGLTLRCQGFAQAMRQAGGSSTLVIVSLQDQAGSQRQIAAAVTSTHADGVIVLGAGEVPPALAALRGLGVRARGVKLATFDLSPVILAGLRSGAIEFAVDQQPYLQGYLPILYLTQYRRYGLLADRGSVVATGPSFVTQANVAQVTKLTQQGIR